LSAIITSLLFIAASMLSKLKDVVADTSPDQKYESFPCWWIIRKTTPYYLSMTFLSISLNMEEVLNSIFLSCLQREKILN